MDSVLAKKAKLGRLRRRPPVGTMNFDHSQDLELTLTSNAIKGKNPDGGRDDDGDRARITVGSKPLKDHLEAVDRFAAIAALQADFDGLLFQWLEATLADIIRALRRRCRLRASAPSPYRAARALPSSIPARRILSPSLG